VASVVSVPTRSTQTAAEKPRRGASNTAWARFRRDRVAGVALIALAIVVALAIIAPWLAPDPSAVDLDAVKRPPNAAHWLGTDSAGRDVLARLVYGARVSMSVGIAAVAIATCVGTLVSDLRVRRWKDRQPVDALHGVRADVPALRRRHPGGAGRPNLLNVVLVIGLLSWPGLARLIHRVLSLRQQQYVGRRGRLADTGAA
jgi:peptide/nickel transport system permease protein